MLQSLYSIVIQIDLGYLKSGFRQPLFSNGEAVVLGGNKDPPRLQILHRLIQTPMSELQLIRSGTQGKGDDLVPEADAVKHGFAYEFTHLGDGFLHHCRVARPIGNQHRIGMVT